MKVKELLADLLEDEVLSMEICKNVIDVTYREQQRWFNGECSEPEYKVYESSGTFNISMTIKKVN
jgi:hypothetical protein